MTNEQKDKVQKELQKIKEAQKELAKIYMALEDADEIQVYCKAHNSVYYGILTYLDVVNGDLEKHLRRDH